MTKEAGVMLLLSDETRSRLSKGAEDLVEVGHKDVRGRRRQLFLWTVPGAEIKTAPAAQSNGAGEASDVTSVVENGGVAGVPATDRQ
jgi:hypothetical protein